ncbi:Hypothetical protein ETEE_2463 [Edwardsiella anguillarum ET080813]|uniref:Uncharacterized protein n=1 Tax=Edwardsiella anguillarum ET080813 TaxID=667120 RepID=A0A076LTI5_9GAMM|nr:Hypothetical protein ETEE_2463 [Edwardsiella anguillarum ET080813]
MVVLVRAYIPGGGDASWMMGLKWGSDYFWANLISERIDTANV